MNLLRTFLASLMMSCFLGGQVMAFESIIKIGNDDIGIGRVYFKKLNVSLESDYMHIIVNTNPTTGFDWVVSDYDEQIIKVLPAIYQPASKDAKDKALCGGGSISDIKITSLKEGKTSFNFRYMRPWDGGEIADQFKFYVEVDKDKYLHIEKVEKITVEYGY